MPSLVPFLEYHDPPVRLHSGGESHWFVRGDLMFADDHLRESILDFWEDALGQNVHGYKFVGVPRGGVPWAEAMQRRQRLSASPKSILVTVEDVVTTGASLHLFNEKQKGWTRPYHCLVVVSRTDHIPYLWHVWATMRLADEEPHA